MRKMMPVMLCLIMLLVFVGCQKDDSSADMSKVDIDYGTSSIYSQEDREAAVEAIKKEFNQFGGCELHSLSYMSDEECNTADNIAWMNDLEKANENKEVFTQCIAFHSSFRSPKNGGDAWDPDTEYTWTWWLARSEGSDWKLMTYGY